MNLVEPRKEGVLAVLASQGADSIGVQECKDDWNDFLRDEMKARGYERIGVSSVNHHESYGFFATYIFYNAAKYDVIDSGTFWMSDTPEVVSRDYSRSNAFRTCTWAIFRNKTTGFCYAHLNLHIDWEDEDLTVEEVKMIKKFMVRLHNLGYPVFATGDFNSKELTPPYNEMLSDPSIINAKTSALQSCTTHTFPNYGAFSAANMYTLDYCFSFEDNVDFNTYYVFNYKPGGVWLSDHAGIFIDAIATDNSGERLAKFTAGEVSEPEIIINENKITVKFGAVKDSCGNNARSYCMTVTDSEGGFIAEDSFTANTFSLTEETEISFGFIIPGYGDYTVCITPAALDGTSGTAGTFVISVKEPAVSDIPSPDLLSLEISEDGTLSDSSGNNFAVYNNGGVITDTIRGKALSFDGSGYASVPEFGSLYNDFAGGFSLEVLFATGSDKISPQGIVSNMNGGGFGVLVNNGKIVFQIKIGSEYVYLSSPCTAGTEYHVVAVYNVTGLKLYVNGVLVDSKNVSESFTPVTAAGAMHLCIGGDSNASGGAEYPAECTVYNVALRSWRPTDAQAAYMYGTMSLSG